MTRIKICGITNREDAEAALAYGADALGFIAVPESPRFVSPIDFGRLTERRLFPAAKVVVAQNPLAASEYAEDYLEIFIQYYEEAASAEPSALHKRLWYGGQQGYDRFVAEERERTGSILIRSFRVADEATLDEIRRFDQPVMAIHLDAYHKDKLGGSGETFNWDLAVEAKNLTGTPIVLSGGLTPENVQDAIEKVRPYAVDVASGVEAEPGRKDHGKLKAFIRAVREWDVRYGG